MREWINLFETETLMVDDEDDTPSERMTYERRRSIEKAVKLFCEQEIGWDMDRSYAVIYEEHDDELNISTNEIEITMEQFMKLRVFGPATITASPDGRLNVTIKTPPGFNILTKGSR